MLEAEATNSVDCSFCNISSWLITSWQQADGGTSTNWSFYALFLYIKDWILSGYCLHHYLPPQVYYPQAGNSLSVLLFILRLCWTVMKTSWWQLSSCNGGLKHRLRWLTVEHLFYKNAVLNSTFEKILFRPRPFLSESSILHTIQSTVNTQLTFDLVNNSVITSHLYNSRLPEMPPLNNWGTFYFIL